MASYTSKKTKNLSLKAPHNDLVSMGREKNATSHVVLHCRSSQMSPSSIRAIFHQRSTLEGTCHVMISSLVLFQTSFCLSSLVPCLSPATNNSFSQSPQPYTPLHHTKSWLTIPVQAAILHPTLMDGLFPPQHHKSL